jgi:aminoglycoside phosphotransferase (APT) family kinase protein
VSHTRAESVRSLRRHLAAAGLVVAEPIGEVFRVGPWWAERETYVPHRQPPPTWASYVWMHRAMGDVHRALAPVTSALPRPVVATYGPPSSLRRWLRVTASTGGDPELVHWVGGLIRKLASRWPPASSLPSHVVHGDVRLGNVGITPEGRSAYLDWGFSARRPRVHDLAYSLSWMIRRPDGTGSGDDFAWHAVPELLDAYEAGAASRLSATERRAIGSHIASVPLYFAAIAGFTPDPAAALRDAVGFVRIAEWILANADVVEHATLQT